MSDAPKIETVPIDKKPAVPRSGTAGEEDALFTLVDYCESDVTIEPETIASLQGAITPWVCQQAGILSEFFDGKGETRLAVRMAQLAIVAATLARDHVRLSANLLSAGNIYFKHQQYERSQGYYEMVLELPSFDARSERMGAHMGLANCSIVKNDYLEAAYHFDKFLPFVEPSAAGLRNIVLQASNVYARCKDVAGLLFCAQYLDEVPIAELEATLIREKVHLDEAILLIGRLRGFGRVDVAERIFSNWLQSGLLSGESRNEHN